MSEEEFITKFYSCDDEEQFLKDAYHNLNCLRQENKQLKENYERIYNENCKLREEHNITDISLLDENYKIKDNWNKLKEYLINDINYWKEQEKEWIKLGFIKFGGEANNRIIFEKILNKMQEIEQGSDSNENNNI